LDSQRFAAANLKLDWLVRRILVRGQPCIVGGLRKSLKTSLLIDLAISLGRERKFRGEFYVPTAVNVGVLSGESGAATIQETARRISVAKGLTLSNSRVWWGFRLPRLSDAHELDIMALAIRDNALEVLILDPAYLCLLTGNADAQASNLFDMGAVLANVARIGQETGCTIILAHHTRKNLSTPYEPPDLEDLAFSGFQEFARQWLLLGRREPYEPGTGLHRLWLVSGGSAGFGGLWAVDVDEGVIDDEFCGRRWEVTVTAGTAARVQQRQEAVPGSRRAVTPTTTPNSTRTRDACSPC
jgi:replicative DNA helicase